ncbi:MAG: 1,4-alpha-glucan branching protein GlgB [Deltaproteobacteria bacterium]|nr:1,4-alpha-glucan branching protein GlgB [Deltaproteobacteria bacterium]
MSDLERIVAVDHPDPHTYLGIHVVAPATPGAGGDGVVVRAYRPDATRVRVLPKTKGEPVEAIRAHRAGVFEAKFPGEKEVFAYQLEVSYGERTFVQDDAYAFLPTLGDIDVHLAGEGKHYELWSRFGAHVRRLSGVEGTSFVVWAPQARRVSVVGDFNGWDGRLHAMRRLSPNGIWELFVPGVGEGATYKFEIVSPKGDRFLKLDPFAFRTELRPATGGIVHRLRPPKHDDGESWTDAPWLEKRASQDPLRRPWSIYEVHLGAWMKVPEERGHGAIDVGSGHTGRWMTYREIAPKLVAYVKELGFTHVELMPITEYPYDGSWGYQVTGYFSPTARYGTPEDLKFLIDALHAAGIGVILDWVPAHFPRDAHGLRRFDGTAVYEHLDPRQGEHADWGTMVFNYGRPEVRNFLLASALFWLEEYHLDGLRVDAVASMLYLDYSRKEGQWVPNKYGGRENLEAIEFLRELNTLVHDKQPGAVVIAEESTAWPAVSRPVYVGGLGFTFKWNMGWMHDTLAYFQMDPFFRRFHHQKITFGFLYAWSENYVLPLSHDEVVHMKGSLLRKMPGDDWQKFANLRALYGYMWAHPGKKLLFMGGEIAQGSEFNEAASLDWHVLSEGKNATRHRGVQELVSDLNRELRARPELFEADVEQAGFQWIDANDNEQSVASFLRWDHARERFLVCVLNATPVVRRGYRIGVPVAGQYREILNTDSLDYGGSGVSVCPPDPSHDGNPLLVAVETPHHGLPASLSLVLPPLATVWLEGPPMPKTTAATAKSPALDGAGSDANEGV